MGVNWEWVSGGVGGAVGAGEMQWGIWGGAVGVEANVGLRETGVGVCVGRGALGGLWGRYWGGGV